MLISAILCTHNRARYLKKALQSLVRQTLTPDSYDIIVVDNRSTDDTREVVESFSSAGKVRYLYEPTLGLAHARNTGWRHATSPYVAYLDDDAIASPSWLQNIVQVFETVVPRPGCVGGKTEPIWEGPRPEWLGNQLLGALSVIDWSDTPHFLNDLSTEWLVGTNIAFPLDVLASVGGFVPRLDRVGTNLMSSGDLFLERQLVAAGYRCYYHPQIAVGHHVPQSRLHKSWFIRRFYWQGISDGAMQILQTELSPRKRLALATRKAMTLLGSPRDFMLLLAPTNNPDRFKEKCFAYIRVGHIRCLLIPSIASR